MNSTSENKVKRIIHYLCECLCSIIKTFISAVSVA